MAGQDNGVGPSPQDQVRALYDDAEAKTAKAFESAVGTSSFGSVMARSAENVAALSRVGADLADLALRNLRIAGRVDIVRLSRQLHRTEDKLERVLQEVEHLRDELAVRDAPAHANGSERSRSSRRAPTTK